MKHFNKLRHFLTLLVAVVAGYMPASAQLAGGVYTVGGTSPNYATITAAVSAMSAGITGPVTFNIRPGTYATPVAFTAITGASATNRVVFQAESGKGTVTVTAAGSSTTNNYVFRFTNTDYITLRNLTLSNTGTTYGAAVDFVGTSSNDSVVGCLLTGSTGTSTSQYKSRVYANGHTGTGVVIYQDSIISPSYGVYWYGSSTSALSNNTVIANNTIVNPYYSCVYTYYTNGLKVLNNNSPAVTGVGTFYAYYNGYGNNRIEVRGNTANASGSGSMYGLGVYYCAGDAVTPALRGNFSNNNITLNTTGGSVYPVYNYYSQYDSITNNTINAVTTYSSGYAYMYLAYNAPYSVILNNNIVDSSANYYAYNYGVYYAPYSVVKKNNIRHSAGGSGYFYNYPLYYSNYAVVDSNTFIYLKSGTSGYLYNNGGSGGYAYYSDYVSVSGNTMQHLLPSSSGYLYGGMFYYCNYGVCKNNNMMNYAGNTSAYLYGYWSYYGSNNTLDNNYIVDSCGYYTYLYNGYYSPNVTWSNNTHRMYSGTYYIYDYRSYYGAGGNRILNNNFYYTQGNSSYTTYNYMMYGVPNTQYVGNTVRANVAGSYYGYTYQGSASYSNATFANNDISVTSTGGGTVYGLYFQYPNFDTIFNNVVSTATSGTNYTAYIYYPYGGLNHIYNNTFNSNATGGTNYTLYDYNPGSYSGTTKYTNNIISRMGNSGQAPFCMYSNAYVTASDYNNIYAPNTPLMTISSTGYNTISAIRTGTIYEKNSLSYNPGYVNAAGGDLHPDPNNPSAWSVNGRGIHIAGNNTDRSGATRSITPGTGVPDLGAYEFVPLSSPPACTAAPAAPVAGGTQVFTFGQDTAAVITWDATAPVPSAITVKQFSGAVAPTLTGFNATYMYFYDSIGVTGTGAFNYTVKNYYKDPWIGTIASESSLRLAKKDLAWVGYPATAGNSTVWNQFTTAGLSTYGLYTGIDVSNNASANSVAAPSGSFCPGTYPTSIRITNNGNNVINSVQLCWKINGGSTSCTTITAPIPVFNGTIGSNAISVPIGNILYGTGNVNIFAWTSTPNSVVDPANGDDTLNINMHSALSGVYTVGGATPDFTDVITGVNALKTYGMCGPVIFKVRAGSYAGNIDLTNVSGSSSVNRFTMQADDNVPASSVNISYSATGTGDNYVIRLNGLNYVTLKNLTFNATGGSYGYCMTFAGAQNNYDSVIGCTFNTASISNSYFAGIYCYNLTTPNYLVIKNNTVNGGYYGMSFYSTTSNTPGLVIDSNTISNVYYYGINYIYYFDGAKVRYNNISTTSTSAYYGLYYFYCSGNTLPIEFIGNRISGFYGYGTLIYYPYGTAANRSIIRNNIITYNGTSTSYYQLFCGYSTYTDVINNTAINAGGASSSTSYCPGYIYFSSYTGSRAYNNLFANYSGGPAMYCYFYGGYSQACDYNNLYSSGTSLVYDAYNGTTYANLGTWRSSSFASTTLGGFDKNSISYNPGVNTTTGVPNPADPGAWAVNGRGVQMLGNNKDINGAARPDVLAAGVPDVGAVEIDPTSIPPLATPTGPAVVGGKQYFLFGYDTVASVTWNPTLGITDTLEVRQYSGRKAPGFNLVSPTKFMYFYTDIKPRSTISTFDYNTEVYYMAPWLGTMPVEANVKMAEKVGTTWVAYNGSNSATNVSRKFISAPGLAAFGAFTGIDDGTLFSALVKANGSTIICTGSKVTLKASTGTGYSYQWNKNGAPISGATQDSLVVTQAGDYSVTINAPAGTATSITMNVSTVAPPMSQITASGALTYCPGNNLTLMGNTGAGLSYQWQLNGLDISGATAQNYAVAMAGTYTLKVKNIGCTTTSNATVVNAGPLVVDLGTDTTFCQTKYIPFILDAGVPGAKYQWSTGDTTQKISVSTKSGDYWVLVNAGANCVDADTIHLLVHPLPSVNAINSLPLGNNTYAFSPAGAQNINNVLWIFGDGTTSNSYTTQHTFPDGNVIVKLVMYNDCGSDTAMILRWATNVGSTTSEGFDVKLYPNPASDKLTLTLDGNVYLKDVTILNSVGAVVYRSEVNDNAKQAVIDVAPYANGQYIIRANTSEGAVSKPFNIVR